MATYIDGWYFDTTSTGGDGTTSATSGAQAAFNSIASLNTICNNGDVLAGHIVKFKRGQTFLTGANAVNIYSCEGSIGNPITFRDYGAGDRPIINTAVTVTGSWNGPTDGVYDKTESVNGPQIWVDNVAQRLASDAGCTDGDFYFGGGNLYYRPPVGHSPSEYTIEKNWAGQAFYFTSNNIHNSYLTFDGLHFNRNGLWLNAQSNITGITIQNCEFRQCYSPTRGAGVVMIGYSTASFTDVLIQDNIFDYVYAASICVACDTAGTTENDNVQILSNTITNNNTCPKDDLEWGSPGGAEANDNDCIAIQNIKNSTISQNDMSGYCSRNAGITWWMNHGTSGVNNELSRNFIHDLLGSNVSGLMGAIRYDAFNDNSTHSIKIVNNICSNFPGYGIWAANGQDSTNKSYIVNNVFYNGTTGLYLITCGNYIVENNIVHTMTDYYAVDYAPLAGGNVINYNCYYDVSSGTKFQDNNGSRTWAQWKGDGYDGSGVSGDPAFINAGNSYQLATDFKINSSSPCYGAGATGTGITTDYEGSTRKSPPDIGAWEFVGTAYSKGMYASLPSDDANLTTLYTDTDIANVALDDEVRVNQSVISGDYALHEFKNDAKTYNSVRLTWEGQTTTAPSDSVVKLQIYNRTTATWVDVATNSVANANEDFTLTDIVDISADYKDANNMISCRVWQQAV